MSALLTTRLGFGVGTRALKQNPMRVHNPLETTNLMVKAVMKSCERDDIGHLVNFAKRRRLTHMNDIQQRRSTTQPVPSAVPESDVSALLLHSNMTRLSSPQHQRSPSIMSLTRAMSTTSTTAVHKIKTAKVTTSMDLNAVETNAGDGSATVVMTSTKISTEVSSSSIACNSSSVTTNDTTASTGNTNVNISLSNVTTTTSTTNVTASITTDPNGPVPDVPTSQFPTFYRRELPSHLVHFNSDRGRQMFREAMLDGTMELYFPLAEQFLTQAEPAYCAISTLAMCFNALGMDPGKHWKRPWRWYAEEMLECCTPLETIMREGLTFRQFASLARCHGVLVEDYRADLASVEHFRSVLEQLSTTSSTVAEGHASTSATYDPHRAGLRAALVVSFSRKALDQTGDGHMSPIGGYHRGSDSVLIMDVARFKYPPYWVPVERLYESMMQRDKVSQMPRGYCVLSPLSSRSPSSGISLTSVPSLREAIIPTSEPVPTIQVDPIKPSKSCPKCNRPDGTCAQPTHHSHMTSPCASNVTVPLASPELVTPTTPTSTPTPSTTPAAPNFSNPLQSVSAIADSKNAPNRKSDCWLDLDPVACCPPKIRRWFGKLRI